MDYLPLSYRVKAQRCLLVGGGEVALRKARLLHGAGAVITVIAPQITPALRSLIGENGGRIIQGDFRKDVLVDMALVIAATDDDAINRAVASAASARGVLVNVVDNPSLSNVIFPAIIDRSPLTIAISSSGASPVLARLLRAKIESMIPAAYGRLAQLTATFRDRVRARFQSIERRRDFWEEVVQGPVAEMVLAGNDGAAELMLESRLAEQGSEEARGEVYLVGAGPGDPDLLTFKALRLMQKADVVLYDRLVAPEIVDMCRRDAERIYVGKARADHAVPQGDINRLLVSLAKSGKRVVRLKGGDPFIFGRGGEEIEELADERIPFQVVPGITAASGCAAYAGIPLTHRDYAQSVRFVTGHLKDGTINLPWDELVYDRQTLVFYMGLVGLPVICRELISHGRPESTPIALVQQGTTPDQKVIAATLGTIEKRVAEEEIHAPTLLIIGETVTLRPKLCWFNPQAVKAKDGSADNEEH